MAFVANSAPSGWKLGKWSQTSPTTWQEEKLDNSKLVYSFQLVNGPSSFNGSTTVRLKMKDQNTEVLILNQSAQVFVNGSYFGEYGGVWESAGSKTQPGRASVSAQNSRPASKQDAETTKRPSKAVAEQGPAFEQTLAPAQAAKAAPPAPKAAPPAERKSLREPPPAPAAAPAAAPARPKTELAPAPEMITSQPRKPDGLDKSDKSIQQLIAASNSGDVKKVNELLASGIDPDGPAKDGSTPLMAAAKGGHLAVVEALVAAFADPTLGKGEETPMTIAFQKGKQDILKALFAASFNTLDRSIKGGCIAHLPETTGIRSDNQEMPDNAEQELRDVTRILAHVSKDRPESPQAHKKYGNYAHMASNPTDDAEKDSDMMREQSVRLAMKSLVKTANAEITGLDNFS